MEALNIVKIKGEDYKSNGKGGWVKDDIDVEYLAFYCNSCEKEHILSDDHLITRVCPHCNGKLQDI